MTASSPALYTAFQRRQRIASGTLADVALKAKHAADHDPGEPPLVFNDADGSVVELDLRGSLDDVARRFPAPGPGTEPAEESDPAPSAARGPGRPKLGVVAREVTLLPRHWDWLATQPGGASVALRKLVEGARKRLETVDRVRLAREVTYRFMAVMAAGEAGFEESSRALFAGDRRRFEALLNNWPADVRGYALQLAGGAFDTQDQTLLETT